MKDLLKFWKYINENYDEDYIEEALENNEIDINALQEVAIAKLNKDELDSLFGDIINVFMDVSGIDNYGDVYNVLKDDIGMSEDRITKLLEA